MEPPGQFRVHVEVELVPYVTIRKSIVELEIVDVERTIGKWIALIRIVVLVFRQDVVQLKLIVPAHAFPGARRKTVVEGFTDSAGNHNLAKIITEDGEPGSIQFAIDVQKAGQMHAL